MIIGGHNVEMLHIREEAFGVGAERMDPEIYTIDDLRRVPIKLRDEEGAGYVRAVFRRKRIPARRGYSAS